LLIYVVCSSVKVTFNLKFSASSSNLEQCTQETVSPRQGYNNDVSIGVVLIAGVASITEGTSVAATARYNAVSGDTVARATEEAGDGERSNSQRIWRRDCWNFSQDSTPDRQIGVAGRRFQ
jgi:hypothetical protein